MGSNDLRDSIELFSRGGYGTLVGAVAGLLSSLAFFMPSFIDIGLFLDTGEACQSANSCGDLTGWTIMVAIFGTGLGAALGGLLAIGGKKLAPMVLGSGKERTGQIVGGLVGGVLPWLTLSIVHLLTSNS